MWETIRIFVSSTFIDMSEERDWLVQHVFPKLRKKCEERKLRLVDVDLRWGIPEGKITDENLADICLEEIENCNPFFVCLLGSRYGTLAKVNEKRKAELMLQDEQHSITALEIYHRLRKMQEKKGGVLFYFRDVSPIKGVPKDVNSEGDFKKKLAELKDDIYKEVDHDLIKDYSHLYSKDEQSEFMKLNKVAFGNLVFEDLWKQIDEMYPVKHEEQMDELQQEMNQHTSYEDYKSSQFLARKQVLQDIMQHIRSHSGQPVFVTGKAGSGKSSLMAQIIKKYKEKETDTFVLPVFVGLTARTGNVKNIVRYIFEACKSRYNDIDIPNDHEDLHLLFEQLKDRKIAIFIDGLDQISDETCKDLHALLPISIPDHVQLIISAISESSHMKAIKNAFSPTQIFAVDKLEENDIKEIAQNVLQLYGKKIVPVQINSLLQNKGTANPLYLKLVIEELRYFVPKKVGNIDKQIAEYIKSLPSDLKGMIQVILDRLERDNDKNIVAHTLAFISNSRISLSEDELSEILSTMYGKQVPEFQWIISSLKNHLLSCTEKKFQTIHVYHQTIRNVIQERYCGSKKEMKKLHRHLAGYHFEKFESRGNHTLEVYDENNRSTNELLYHFMMAEQWDKVLYIISDMNYLEAQFRSQYIYRFLEDVYALHSYESIPDELKGKVEQLLLFISREKDLLVQYPELVLQQALNQCDVPYLSEEAANQAAKQTEGKFIFQLENKQHVNDQICRKLSESSEVCDVVISQDGKRVSALLVDGTWKMWKVQTAQEEIHRKLPSYMKANAHTVLFNSGKAIFGTDKGKLYAIHIESGILMEQDDFTYDSQAIQKIAVSENEKYAVVVYDNHVVKVWSLEERKELQHYQLSSKVESIKFAASDASAMLLCEQGTVMKIGIVTREEVFVSLGKEIDRFDYVPHEERGIYANQHTVHLITGSATSEELYCDREKRPIVACTMDQNAETAAFVAHNNVHIWKNGYEKLKSIFNVASNINHISFIPNTNQLLCIQENRIIQLLDFEQNNDNSDAVYQKETIFLCDFWNEGKKFNTVCRDGSFKIWDLGIKTTLKLFKEHEKKQIQHTIISKDEKMFVTAAYKDEEHTVTLFDLDNLYEDGREKHIIKPKMEEVKVIARIKEKHLKHLSVSPDGRFLIMQDQFGIVSFTDLYQVKDEKCFSPNKFLLKVDSIISTSFSKDGSLVAVAFSDSTLRIYNLHTKAELFQGKSMQPVKGIKLLPNNKQIICRYEKDVTVMDLSGEEQTLLKHEAPTLDVSTDENQSVASVSGDGLLKIYKEGHIMEQQVWTENESSQDDYSPRCAFLTEGLMLTTSNDQMVRFWKVGKQSIELAGEYHVPGNCHSFAWDENGNIAFADKQGKIHFVRRLHEVPVVVG